MSKQVEFKIDFDKKEPTFTAGSTVSGKVTITPLESIQCRDIVVSMFWSTHGKGNRDKNEMEKLSSGPQRLIAGKDIVIPFSFQLPASPLSYHGTYVNVDYYVKAKIDLALKIDPSAEKDFIVLPGETYFPSRKSFSNRKKLTKKDYNPASPVLWIVSIAVLALLTIFFLSLWFIFLILFIVVSYRPIMNKYAMKKTGKITVDTGNGIINPGKKLPVRISFTPDADLNLNYAKITLSAEEKAVSGSGTNKKTHTHKIVNDVFDLPIEKYIRKGDKVNHQIHVEIPDIAAYTFDTSDNSVTWCMEIHIGIDKWPDWKQNIDLVLCPDVKIVETST